MDPGVNPLGTPSLDGRYLSGVDADTGDLVVRTVATGEMRRLTRKHPKREQGQFAYFSAISRDSKQVAYAWFNEEKFYELRVVSMEGSAPRVLFRNREAGFVQPCSWSPDGTQILTLLFRRDNTSQVALISAEDGSVRILKSLNWFYPKRMDYSPDGRYVVYDNLERPKSAKRDIMLLSADGSREVKIVEHPANDTYPLWAPDGKSVLFLSDRLGSLDVWRVNVVDGQAEGEPVPLVRGLGRILPLGITAAGDYYFGLRTGLTDVYTAALDFKTGKLLREPSLASPHYSGVNSAPDWAPDGRRLAFLTVRGTENYGQDGRLISVRDMETGKERDLETRMSHIEGFRWSADGEAMLLSGSDRRGRAGLFSLTVANGRTAPVAVDKTAGFRGLEGVWSDDGTVVYYINKAELRRHEVESGKEAVVHAHDAELFYPALSPDGRLLAAACRRGDVVLIPVTAGPIADEDLTKVPTPAKGYLSGLAWIPNGKDLLMTIGGEKTETAWLVPVAGGDARKLELPAGIQGAVRPHPDGGRVAFTTGRPKNEVWMLEGILNFRSGQP